MKDEVEFVSKSCEGEKCMVCHQPATKKIGEEHMPDDPLPAGHNLTGYLCTRHFDMVLRPYKKAPGIQRRGHVTFWFEEDAQGVTSFNHETNSKGFKIFELIGLIEMAKSGMIESSYERAKTIVNETKAKKEVQN